MSCTKDLINIRYHTDDDTGMYQIGEVDTGYTGELENYIDKYGKEELLQEIDYIKHNILGVFSNVYDKWQIKKKC